MNGNTYTRKVAVDVADGGKLISVLNCATLDKRIIASAIAEAFISGMAAQERLSQTKQPADQPA